MEKTNETEVYQTQIEQLQSDLADFEQKYGIPSDQLYQQFQAGQTDDRMDYVEWASLAQMAANLQQRLHLLTGEKV